MTAELSSRRCPAYRGTTQEPVTDVRAVRLVIQSPPPEPGDDPYGLTVDEVRLFGLTAP